MFETLFTYSRVLRRHREGPLAEERAAYLPFWPLTPSHRQTPSNKRDAVYGCAVELERWPADHCFDIDEVGEMASRERSVASSSRMPRNIFAPQ